MLYCGSSWYIANLNIDLIALTAMSVKKISSRTNMLDGGNDDYCVVEEHPKRIGGFSRDESFDRKLYRR